MANTVESCKERRASILTEVKEAQNLRKRLMSKEPLEGGDGADKGEVIANVTLALRHLEDARMRYGKAIQAFEGRESIYPA